jgi:hypothetical protein
MTNTFLLEQLPFFNLNTPMCYAVEVPWPKINHEEYEEHEVFFFILHGLHALQRVLHKSPTADHSAGPGGNLHPKR